jgi:large subunit ribosomal protein L10e
MAKLRKAVCYRRLERPYTRVSKFRKHSFVKARPHVKITKFDMGNVKGNFAVAFDLVSKSGLQVRQEAMEASRQMLNRKLEQKIGNANYHFRVRKYPHHILRQNSIASGAGADRLSTGMQLAFGKAIGVAAQVKKGDTLFTIKVNRQHRNTVRTILTAVRSKLPNQWYIVEKNLGE